ncbi:MAG: S1C family serine protease [Clostridia bacterium]
MEELLDKGSVERPALGISEYALIPEAIADAYHVPVGIMVYEVSRGSAAADAGIRQGDIITEIDGRDITSLETVTEILSEHEVGDVVEVTLIRNRNTHEPIKVMLTLQNQGGNHRRNRRFLGTEREGGRQWESISLHHRDNLELLKRRLLAAFSYRKVRR